jgi:hypothetical protein
MFQQCSGRKSTSNNNKIIYLYIRSSVVLVFTKSVWEIFFFRFRGKLWQGHWDQAIAFFLPVGFLLFGFFRFSLLELIAFPPIF